MTKTQLEEIIRKVAREEIRSSLPQILAEMALNAHNNKKTISESATHVSSTVKPKPVISRTVPIAAKPVRKFSSNPILNQILNETEGGISNDDQTSMRAMMGESIGTSSDVPLEVFAKQDPTGGTIIKDYSAFLKKVDKAAKSNRPA